MRIIALALVILLGFIPVSQARVFVVTSTYILSVIVKEIGSDSVSVDYIIPASTNPHLFSPRPRALLKLAGADLFVGVGFGFEFWMDRVRELLRGKQILMLGNYYKHPLQVRVMAKGRIANPHIWLDMDFMSRVAFRKIAGKLCSLDRAHCSLFFKNADELSERVKEIEKRYREFFKNLKDFCFVDIKPAFEYLLKSSGVSSCCVLIESGSGEPTVGSMKRLFERCRCRHGLVMYVSDSRIARMIASRLGYKSVELNPLGAPEITPTYESLLIMNLKRIKSALR